MAGEWSSTETDDHISIPEMRAFMAFQNRVLSLTFILMLDNALVLSNVSIFL